MKYVLFSATALLFSLLLNGCAFSLPFSVTDPRTGKEYTVPSRLASVPGIHELAEACAERSGRVVHETVYVDGYFDASWRGCDQACWRSLSDSDYRYMEIKVNQVEKWLFLKELGYWRISKVPKNDSRCAPKPSHYIAQRAVTDKKEMDHCLVFEKIDEPMSRYEYTSRGKHTVIDNDERSELWENKRVVIDRETGEVIAYDVFPHLAPNITTNRRWQTLNCQTIGVEPEAGNNVLNKEVLKTK
jgi:hypothetical protein